MAGRHELHRTTASTPLQVHAWDLDAGRLVRLEPGGAPSLRPRCREGRLVCPFPGCPQPALTAVAEYTNRYGTEVPAVFRHRNAASFGHEPESWFHLTGKLLVAQWLRELWPEAEVYVERVIDRTSRRRPDVTADLPDGTALAVEVQYAPLTLELWRTRTADIERAGYRCVWLWGHLPPHGVRLGDAERSLRPAAAPQRSWTSGTRPHWIDPQAEELWSLAPGARREAPDWPIVAEPLSAASVVAGVLVTPTDEAAIAHDLAVAAERAAAEVREAERRARVDALALAEAQRLERIATETAEERARREEYRARARAAEAAAWEESPLRRCIVERYGAVPAILATDTPRQARVFRHPEQWRAEVFMAAVQGRVSETVPYKAFVRVLLGGHENPLLVYQALNSFLFELRREGYVDFSSFGARIGDDIEVLADLDAPPSKRAAPSVPAVRRQPRPLPTSDRSRIRSLIAALDDGETTTTTTLIASAGISPTATSRHAVVGAVIDLVWAGKAAVRLSRDVLEDGPIWRGDDPSAPIRRKSGEVDRAE